MKSVRIVVSGRPFVRAIEYRISKNFPVIHMHAFKIQMIFDHFYASAHSQNLIISKVVKWMPIQNLQPTDFKVIKFQVFTIPKAHA